MKTDRELLELAAKAAGIPYKALPHSGSCWGKWDPLNDDSDALRLAVKLSMSVDIDEHEDSTYAYAGDQPRVYAMELWQGNKDAATRRAIVRAAAAIGETL